MHRTLGRRRDHGVFPDQLIANLGGAPGRVFALEVQDGAFNLKGQLIGVAVGPSTAVLQAIKPTVVVAIEDFVSRGPRDAELSAEARHLLPVQKSGYKLKAFIHWLTLLPRHLGFSQIPTCVNHVSGIRCKLCLRYDK